MPADCHVTQRYVPPHSASPGLPNPVAIDMETRALGPHAFLANHSLLFGEYDPHFEGDEPLGCDGELGAVALIAALIGIGWSVLRCTWLPDPGTSMANLARLWASWLGMVNATPLIVTLSLQLHSYPWLWRAMSRSFSPTFAIGAVGIAKPVYFQPAVPQGLHYIFSAARA